MAASDDPTTGLITFRITTNQAALSDDALLMVFVDSDKSASTGDEGADYLVAITSGGFAFGRWNGTDYDFDGTPQATVLFGYGAGVATFAVNKSELGNTAGFVFGVASAQLDGEGNVLASDAAPDETHIDYALTPKLVPLVLRAGKPVANPVAPRSGKALTVVVPVKRSDTGKLATSGGTVLCKVTVGGKTVRAAGRFGPTGPRCVLTVPARTKGKYVRGTMTVTIKAAKVSKSFLLPRRLTRSAEWGAAGGASLDRVDRRPGRE